MNRCPKCKNELAAEARFCNICGTLQVTAPAASNPTRTIQPDIKHVHPGREHTISSSQAGSLVRPITLPPAISKTTIDSTSIKTSPLNEQQKSGAIEGAATAPLQSQAGNAPLAQTPPKPTPGLIRPIITSSSLRQNTPAAPSQSSKTPPQPQAPLHSSSARQESIPDTPAIPSTPPVPTRTEPLQPGTFLRPRPAHTPSPDLWMQQKQRLAEQRAQQESALPTQPLPQAGEKRRQEYVGFNSSAQSSQRLSWHDMPTNSLQHGITNGAYNQSNGRYNQVGHQELPIFSPESFAYTSKAAEHWRNSWRDRQYAEAGPAEDVSKGQASVPAPLMAMQNSFVRMRAIINKQKQGTRSTNLGFWVTLILMICLTGGLGTYTIWTFLPNASFGAAHIAQPGASQQASLVLEGTSSTTFIIGQTMHVHGENFGANDPIRILLDTTTPVLSVSANNQGAFDATIPIGKNWPVGTRIIQAIDDRADMSAFLDIQVNPAASPETSSPNLSITLNGQAIQSLPFSYQIGQPGPGAQRITITNKSDAPLQWSAAASATNNLSWLMIEDNDIEGQLDISQPHSIGIGVDVTGLRSSPANKPYTGQIVFTINQSEELTLPVQLTIIDATSEMTFSPEPIIAVANSDGTCQPGVTLTLINLGTAVITWSVNPDLKDNIQFIDNMGKVTESGDLEPSGTIGDTVIVTLRCFAVQKGHQYHVTIFANKLQWSETVIVQ